MAEEVAATMATVSSLTADFARLGVQAGMTVLVHSSLKSLGWVCGGAVAVIEALENLLGPTGTLVMPTHSGDLSEPSYWQHPPVPSEWWPVIRQQTPPFRPDLTPTRQMGIIPETFRKQDGVLRSYHPADSFAAWGQHASFVTANHSLEHALGESSPLARVYDLDGWVLLLGITHANNTSLHLAEQRANFAGKGSAMQGAPMLVDGQRQWVTFEALNYDDSDFPQIGADFQRDTQLVRTGPVGSSTTLLMPQRPLVDYGVGWLEKNRTGVG